MANDTGSTTNKMGRPSKKVSSMATVIRGRETSAKSTWLRIRWAWAPASLTRRQIVGAERPATGASARISSRGRMVAPPGKMDVRIRRLCIRASSSRDSVLPSAVGGGKSCPTGQKLFETRNRAGQAGLEENDCPLRDVVDAPAAEVVLSRHAAHLTPGPLRRVEPPSDVQPIMDRHIGTLILTPTQIPLAKGFITCLTVWASSGLPFGSLGTTFGQTRRELKNVPQLVPRCPEGTEKHTIGPVGYEDWTVWQNDGILHLALLVEDDLDLLRVYHSQGEPLNCKGSISQL